MLERLFTDLESRLDGVGDVTPGFAAAMSCG